MTNIIKKALQVMVVVGSLAFPSAVAFAAYDNSLGVVASCTAADRGIATFSCSSFPTQWITGTAPNLSCYSGATVPTCGANQQFNCNSGSCVCNAGFTNCGSGCVATPFPTNNCAPGQTYNACTGCSGPSYVTLQTGTPTRQGAAATNATISVYGNLDLAGGTQGDVYLSSGKMLRVDGASATSLNIGNITSPSNFTLSVIGDLWVDDHDTTGKGIQLEAADRPIITRGWDTFSSGIYAGVGRWGLFMEPNVLALGTPNVAGKSFRLRAYNADSTSVDRFSVDMSTGNTTVTGGLSVGGATTLNTLNVTGTTTLNNVNITGTINSANGFTLPAGAGAGKVLTSDAAGVASWQNPAASGIGGSGTINTLPKFTAASTLGNSLVSESGTTVTVGGSLAVAGNLSLPTATAVGLGNVANALNFDSNTLVVDALNNRVGVNTAVPIMPLAVQSDTGANTVADAAIFFNRVGVAGANGQGTRIYINAQQGTSRGTYIEGVITTSSSNGHDMVFGTSAASSVPTERMRITSSGNLLVGADTDVISTFGRTDVGCSAYSDYACISHVDQDATGTYALLQYNDGRTFLNAAPSQPLYLRIGNADRVVIRPSGDLVDVRGMTTESDGIALGGKLGISGGYGTDKWLRLNQDGDFANGVYTPLRLRVDQGIDARASTAAAAITATSNSSGSWAAAIIGNSYTSANSYGQDGSMWIAGSLDVEKNHTVTGFVRAMNGLYVSATEGFRDGGNDWIQTQNNFWVNGKSVQIDGTVFLTGGKEALRGNDSWLRLNQASQYTSGTHTPSNFNAAGGITVGSLYYSPGAGNLEVQNATSTKTLEATNTFNGPNGGSLYPTTYKVELAAGVHNSAMSSFVYGNNLFDHYNRAAGLFVNSQNNSYPNVTTSSGVYTYLSYWNGSGSQYSLYSNKGTITNGSSFPSSRRWKHDVTPLQNPLEKLLKMRGVDYTWNEDAPFGDPGQRDIGVIAEEIQAQYPMLVELDEEGKPFAVDYAKLTPVIIEAVREQQEIIDGLRSDVETLEARLQELESKLR